MKPAAVSPPHLIRDHPVPIIFIGYLHRFTFEDEILLEKGKKEERERESKRQKTWLFQLRLVFVCGVKFIHLFVGAHRLLNL